MTRRSSRDRNRLQFGKHAASVFLCSLAASPEQSFAHTAGITTHATLASVQTLIEMALNKNIQPISEVYAPGTAASGSSYLFWGSAGAAGVNSTQPLKIDLNSDAISPVTIITSSGPGIEARSHGQSGGGGGNAFGFNVSYAAGGNGGDGGTASDVIITTSGPGSITTTGASGHGVVAISQGGNGGQGGSITGLGFGVSEAGNGGNGARSGNISVKNTFDVSTTGKGADGILARSIGGAGGAGGSVRGVEMVGIAGHGAHAAGGGAVYVSHAGKIVTQGDLAHGIHAQSLGGNAGDGGGAFGIVALGGHGSTATTSGPVIVVTQTGSEIRTFGKNASGILAQSISGIGADGGDTAGLGPISGGGEKAANSGDVTIQNGARITTTGDDSGAAVAQSIGGNGGNGGFAGGVLFAGTGHAGGAGNSGRVQLLNTGDITTRGDRSDGLIAQSIGGSGGNGGDATTISGVFTIAIGGRAGAGGSANDVCVNCNSAGSSLANLQATTIRTTGDLSIGILAQSIGGGGGKGGGALALGPETPATSIAIGASGGKGGEGGNVSVGANGSISTNGNFSAGISASSIGGGGGLGGYAISGSAATEIGAVSLAYGGNGGASNKAGSVTVDTRVDIATRGDHSTGISATSIGGGGGSGGLALGAALSPGANITLSFGGTGGTGATADKVLIRNTGSVTTGDAVSGSGANSAGILAQSVGGGGGNGGFTVALAAGPAWSGQVSIGGHGGTGGSGGEVSVFNNDAETVRNVIATHGAAAPGLIAQSIGGGGGNGGISVASGVGFSGAVSLSMGGKGASGGTGHHVTVASFGKISTAGDGSGAIIAQSIGGGGGNGSFSASGAAGAHSLAISVGGAGDNGGAGSAVNVSTTGDLTTRGAHSNGITAQSVGGGGGNGGMTVSGSLGDLAALAFNLGGTGGTGGSGSAVSVTSNGMIHTTGDQSSGILAQSIGGGGGAGGIAISANGSLSNAAVLNIGGKGVTAGDAGTVKVNSTGDISTKGALSSGIAAQSIGGGGGNGGFSVAASLAGTGTRIVRTIGGDSVNYSPGGKVLLNHTGAVQTTGAESVGILAQSIGGGGGSGGGAIGFTMNAGNSSSISSGGKGGKGSDGDSVSIVTAGEISTTGVNAQGVLGQSIGGGGGNGGLSVAAGMATEGEVNISIGGSAGASGQGGRVTISNESNINTSGKAAGGITAQSIGGGGGTGGISGVIEIGPGASFGMTTGGAGGSGGNAETVQIYNRGDITTSGANAIAALAQSIGGGGGAGNLNIGAAASTGKSVLNAVGGSGAAAGNGSAVTLSNAGHILTHGDGANAMLAQSIGGGGGNGGFTFGSATIGGDFGSMLRGFTKSIQTVGSQGGASGDAGDVRVINAGDVKTTENAAPGAMAQSIGGGGGSAGFTGTLSLAMLVSSTGAQGSHGGKGGAIEVNNTGSIITLGDNSSALIAQSIGGGGGTNAYTFDVVSLLEGGEFITGGQKNPDGDGGTVTISTKTGTIQTSGALAYGVIAQSIGGGGGVTTLTSSQKMKSESMILLQGAVAGSSGNGHDVHLDTASQIATAGAGATGAIVQSIGGGGGISGIAHLGTDLQIEGRIGADGSWGKGGVVSVSASGSITTAGHGAAGLIAQSIGGGGGVLTTIGVTPGHILQMGATFGGGGDSSIVTVKNTGQIATAGDRSTAVIAQSIGGGGGAYLSDKLATVIWDGHKSASAPPITDPAVQRPGGDGAAVSVTNGGAIRTTGAKADGIVAQSIGGGGGLASGFMGSMGGRGAGSSVSIGNSAPIEVSGAGSIGIFAQSAGGTGAGNVSITTSGDVIATGAGAVAIHGVSHGDMGGDGDVNITIDGATVQGGPGGRAVVIETRSVGRLVNSGHLTTSDGPSGVAISVDASKLTFSNNGKITGDIELHGGASLIQNNESGVIYAGKHITYGVRSTFRNLGVIMPGGRGEIMETRLSGMYEQPPTGRLVTKLSPGDNKADRLKIKGPALLHGTLSVLAFEPGYARPGTFETPLLQAEGGISAEDLKFVPAPTAVANFHLRFPNANNVGLGYSVDFMPEGLRPNQKVIGATINRIQLASNHSAFSPVTAQVFNLPTHARLASGYADLSGESLSAGQSATFAAMSGFGGDVMNATRSSGGSVGDTPVIAQKPLGGVIGSGRIWANFGGGIGRQRGAPFETGSASETHFYSGLSAGVDLTKGDGSLAGVAIGVGQGGFNVHERRSMGQTQHFSVGAYGRAVYGDAYISGLFSLGSHRFKTTRTLALGDLPERATGDYGGGSINGYAEAGRRFTMGHLIFTPFAAVDYKLLRINGFNEHTTLPDGSAGHMGLALQPQRSRSLESQLGLELRAMLPMGEQGVVSPWLRAAWVHEFSTRRNLSAAFRAAPAFGFGTVGARAPADQPRIGVGVTAQSGPVSLTLRGDATLSGRRTAWRGAIEAQYRW